MKITAWIIFAVLQTLFLPLAVVGLVVLSYRQLWLSRKLGVSSTAVDVISSRWQMHLFGLRDDPATAKLVRELPNFSTTAMWMLLFPLYFIYRLTGENLGYPAVAERGHENVVHVVRNRTLYFDEIIRRSQQQLEQFVVLGAGFDTRCYGDLGLAKLACFELDQPNIQQIKKRCLQRAGIDANHVEFVEIDFATEKWFEKLAVHGFDPNKSTLFHWEGVTLYLPESAVRDTLRNIKNHAVLGSVIAADFYSLFFTSGQWLGPLRPLLKTLKLTSEEFQSGLDLSDDGQATFRQFIDSQDLQVGELYLMGSQTRSGTWMLVSELIVAR